MRRGALITVEGIDGVGKTTAARLVVSILRKRGISAVYTREPSDGPYGRMLRRLLRQPNLGRRWERALLFALDRAWHVENVISPLVRRGMVVVCDRYVHSQLAYQVAEGIERELVERLNASFPVPDLVILLDSEPSVALMRIREAIRRLGIRQGTVYDDEAFLRRVRDEYLRYLNDRRFTQEYAVIDVDSVVGRDFLPNDEYHRRIAVVADMMAESILRRLPGDA